MAVTPSQPPGPLGSLRLQLTLLCLCGLFHKQRRVRLLTRPPGSLTQTAACPILPWLFFLLNHTPRRPLHSSLQGPRLYVLKLRNKYFVVYIVRDYSARLLHRSIQAVSIFIITLLQQ